jgi:hypothetical protein
LNEYFDSGNNKRTTRTNNMIKSKEQRAKRRSNTKRKGTRRDEYVRVVCEAIEMMCDAKQRKAIGREGWRPEFQCNSNKKRETETVYIQFLARCRIAVPGIVTVSPYSLHTEFRASFVSI